MDPSTPRWRAPALTLFAILGLFVLVGGFFLRTSLVTVHDRDGLNKVLVTCDGKQAEISTQRYTGFVDDAIGSFKEFPDLPIHSLLHCQSARVDFERRADLLDRTMSRVLCGDEVLGTSAESSLSIDCDQAITIEVLRK